MDRVDTVAMYTDGACTGNPGAGGYGVLLLSGTHRKELSGGYRTTTNNRMEMMAVIEGLRALKRGTHVIVHSDSQYVVNAINQGWAKRWRANNWRRNKNESALNPDLWNELLDQLDRHDVDLKWVKGHAGDPGNERADALAVLAAKGRDLQIDDGYEAQRTRSTQRMF